MKIGDKLTFSKNGKIGTVEITDVVGQDIFFAKEISEGIPWDTSCPFYKTTNGYRIPLVGYQSSYWALAELIDVVETTKRRVVFCNFPYVAGVGDFRHTEISEDEAKKLVSECGDNWLSAIGHEATASTLSEIFGKSIQVNRINYVYQRGDVQLIMKLNKRQAEGSILDKEALEQVGYTFSTITAI